MNGLLGCEGESTHRYGKGACTHLSGHNVVPHHVCCTNRLGFNLVNLPCLVRGMITTCLKTSFSAQPLRLRAVHVVATVSKEHIDKQGRLPHASNDERLGIKGTHWSHCSVSTDVFQWEWQMHPFAPCVSQPTSLTSSSCPLSSVSCTSTSSR